MKYSELFDTLQNLIYIRPTQQAVAKILGVSQPTLAGKISRDSQIKPEDIEKLEEGFGINLRSGVQGMIEADYYPDVFGSCGNGAFFPSENKEKIYIPKNSFWDYSKNEKYSVISAIGDSMTPVIKDRDKLIVKQWNGEQIADNRIYIFCYDDRIFIKRLVYNINELIIKSDNAQYSTVILQKNNLDNFFVIGQIVGSFRDLR